MMKLNVINPVNVRILTFIVALIFIVILPWWLSTLMLLGLVIYFPLYFEVLFFGFIFDMLYVTEIIFPYTALTATFVVLLAFDVNQFEGRMERPISQSVFNFLVIFLFLIGIVFVYKLWNLQVVEGEKFRIRSDNNNLRNTIIFADRGVIYDRNNVPIVWNAINSQTNDFSLRIYATSTGLSTTLGYVKYPSKDSSGIYYQNRYDPIDGLEKVYDTILSGMNGIKIIETDVKGNIVSESVIQKPVDGDNLPLSIDLNLQRKLNESLLDIADRAGYRGGSGVIMDIATGEILAISNFPEYSSQVMTDGSDSKKINAWVNNKNYPFLNRAINGLYTPGSIMKIFIAMGVLDLAVINPSKQIVSTGSISIPNPFIKDKPSIFLDWKAHGPVDLRRAIAVSSNVYFYEVTGGFESQPEIGILNIENTYSRMTFKTSSNFIKINV